MNFSELFAPAALAANFEEVASNKIPYLGAGLFPAKKKAGLDLSWFKGSKGLPVSLMPTSFDAQVTFRDRISVSKVETEMPFFREGFKLKERDRQELLRVQESNDPYAAAVIARVYDDSANLIEAAEVVAERMRMQLLFAPAGEMGIIIKANGVDYTYEYDANDVWKGTNYSALSGTALWSAASTADPISDMETLKRAIIAQTGEAPKNVIMNSVTFGYMKSATSFKNYFISGSGVSGSAPYITDALAAAFVKDLLDLNIAVYDKQYKNESGTAGQFVPDGYVSMIPDGALGNTWYGTTPEEADLMASKTAEVALVNTGVAVTRIVEPQPVNVNIIASEIVLPSFERMNECGLLKVIA